MISRLLSLFRHQDPEAQFDFHVRQYRSMLRGSELVAVGFRGTTPETTTGFKIELDRIQYTEREQLRAAMERELSGKDSQECIARVKRRMIDGDSVFIAPRYNAREAYVMWRRRHRKHRSGNLLTISEEKRA